jgi:alkaline phosphatase
MKKFYFSAALCMLLVVVGAFRASIPAKQKPNIILLIGDGMGVTQLSTAFLYAEEPNLGRLPVVGLSRTASSKEKITDSAAGATALACGEKTYNGAISVSESGDSLATLVELLSREGYKTGLISTSSITHATPACFYAHVSSRKMEEEIATYLMKSEVDFFAGGGRSFFTDRKDGVDLTAQSPFTLSLDSLPADKLDPSKRYGFLLAKDGMPKMESGRGDFSVQATQLALQYFEDGEAPFFLMIEGSQIDWGGHANDGGYIVAEMLDFDKTVGAALDFAERQGNTLVVVTADHETGGFTLAAKQQKIPFKGLQENYADVRFEFSTFGHSAAMVPVLASGTGSAAFAGIYQNTEIFKRVLEAAKAK